MARRGRAWPAIAAALSGVVLLCALGAWQIQRLQWKQALITQLEERRHGVPIRLADAVQRRAKGDAVDFLKVSVSGEFKHAAEKHFISTLAGGPAWEIVTPFVTDDGWVVLINRGSVPDDLKDAITRPDGRLEVAGLARTVAGEPGLFDPQNDPVGNRWYWWDLDALLESSRLPNSLRPVPFVLQMEPGPEPGEYPQPQSAGAKLTNNHLSYAVTWFSMAAALVIIAALYLRQERGKPSLEAGSQPR